jgi:hypothetical protein
MAAAPALLWISGEQAGRLTATMMAWPYATSEHSSATMTTDRDIARIGKDV